MRKQFTQEQVRGRAYQTLSRLGGLPQLDEYTRKRNFIRQILMANREVVNAGPGFLESITLRLRDVYSREELARKFERGRHGGNIRC